MTKPARIVWNRLAKGSPRGHAEEAVPISVVEAWRASDRRKHRGFELAPNLLLELPAPDWGHADLLVYLPERGWLVRREHSGDWYVDVGTVRRLQDDLYLWTDLWLDVIAPEPATRYHVLDCDEFAEALRQGQLSTELAAWAMERLHELVNLVNEGGFPPAEVRRAEAFAAEQEAEG